MKTLKSKYFNDEKLKLKELNEKEQQDQNGYKYIITYGEYDDVEFEEDSLQAATEWYNDYGN